MVLIYLSSVYHVIQLSDNPPRALLWLVGMTDNSVSISITSAIVYGVSGGFFLLLIILLVMMGVTSCDWDCERYDKILKLFDLQLLDGCQNFLDHSIFQERSINCAFNHSVINIHMKIMFVTRMNLRCISPPYDTLQDYGLVSVSTG